MEKVKAGNVFFSTFSGVFNVPVSFYLRWIRVYEGEGNLVSCGERNVTITIGSLCTIRHYLERLSTVS